MVRVNRRGYCQAYSVVRAARGGWRFRRYYLNNNRRFSAAPPLLWEGGAAAPPRFGLGLDGCGVGLCCRCLRAPQWGACRFGV